MKKYLYLIKKAKIKSWLKFWLLTKDQVKYILSEILEGFSFNLQNTVKRYFKIFNIFGNSVQDGTPTPTNPVPINSVADDGILTIKIRGKNLLNVTATSRTYNNTLIVTVNNDKSITFNGMNSSNETLYFRLAPNFDLQAGTYTLSNKNSNVGENSAIFYDDGGNFEPRSNIVTKTFSNIVTVKPYIKISIGATFDNFTIYPMIEQNLTVTDYEPYQANDYTFQTEPLRSLPNGVRDSLEADGIHRRVGKIVLDGSEDWSTTGTFTSGIYRPECSALNGIIKPPSSSNISPAILCNYYNAITNNQSYTETEGISISASGSIRIYDSNYNTDDISLYKTWLSTHNTEVIYELAEEIIEPYTEEQQEQYNKIKELYTFNGTTYISSDDEVPPYLQIQYYMKGE